MPRRLLIGTAVLVAFAIVGVAWATIPSKDGTINACYMNKTGIVRIIDAPTEKCLKIETPISWNRAGPQGAPGLPGGVSGYTVVRVMGSWPQGDQHTVTAACPTGTSALGGGWFPGDYQGSLVVLGSYPDMVSGGEIAQGWSLYAFNGSLDFGPATAWVYATCATTT